MTLTKDGKKKETNLLYDKAYDVASNPEYDGYQRGLASIVYKFLIRNQRQSLVL